MAVCEKRIGELEVLIAKIYEDNALGKLSDKRYTLLYNQYEGEQEQLQGEVDKYKAEQRQYDSDRKSTARFSTVMTRKVNYVLEADIIGFFDNLDQKWLMKFLEHDIADKNFLRYVMRFLKAGIMEGTEKRESDRGTPQGGQISPVLANVYLHYVLDQWYDILLRKSCKGEVYYVRYADDFLFLFQYENEAKAVM